MLPADPLFGTEWFLQNTGQSGGTPGIDIDAVPAWTYATGLGVHVLDIDTGLDITNPDIAPNYDAFIPQQSADPPGNSPYPANPNNTWPESALAHGTATAGLIAAAANTGGIVGVAYQASLSAYRLLDTNANSADPQGTTVTAFNLASAFDVVNCSWLYNSALVDSVYNTTESLAVQALANTVAKGRGGKGTIFVFAAGNGYVSADDTNLHAFQSSIDTITVAGIDDNGTVNTPSGRFSQTGASILVSAPAVDVESDTIAGLGGADGGDVQLGLTGTSFAAPQVAGVVALMLQVNPNLGFRDVQQILAYTARQTDAANASWHANHATNWNGGGLEVSNDYGYGLVDAAAAVALARNWPGLHDAANRVQPSIRARSAGAIPAAGSTFTFSVAASRDVVLNWVQVELNLTFTSLVNLRVVLTSPAGTSSVFLNQPNGGAGLQSLAALPMQLTSAQFWGEHAAGDWTLWIGAADPTKGDSGTVSSLFLSPAGDAPGGGTTFVYTDAYAAQDASRHVLSDASGTADTLDAAAVSTPVVLDLTQGGVSRIAGTPLTIGSGTFIQTAIAGNAGATIRGNDSGDLLEVGAGTNSIMGGAGNDTIVAAAGYDTIDGGGGTNAVRLLSAPPPTAESYHSGSIFLSGPGESFVLTNIREIDLPAMTVSVPAVIGLTIAGTKSGISGNDRTALSPFAGVSVSAPDFGQTVTATVSVSNPANGSLTGTNGGVYDPVTGVFRVQGTLTGVSAVLAGLVFTPAEAQVSSGQTVTTGFTIAVADPLGGTATDTTTSTIVTAVAAPVVLPSGAAYTVVAANETIQAAGGLSRLTLNSTRTLVLGGPGRGIIADAGLGDTIMGGTGGLSVTATSGDPLILGGAGPLFFGNGAAAATVSGGNGPATMSGGAGGGQFHGGNGPMVFIGGTGASTVTGGLGGGVIFAGAGSPGSFLAAGWGPATLVGGGNTASAPGGANLAGVLAAANGGNLPGSGAGGADTLAGGPGSSLMIAGSGPDEFLFANGAAGGTATIWNFVQGLDRLVLSGYGANPVTSVVAGSGATTITLSDDTRIVFANVEDPRLSDFL